MVGLLLAANLPGALSTGRVLAAAALLAVMVASTALVGVRVATWVSAADDALLRVLVAVVAALTQMAGIPLLLGMVDLLSLPAVVITHVVLAVAAVTTWPNRPPADGPPRTWDWDWFAVVAVAASAAWLAASVALSLRHQRPLISDTMEYHISNLASWLQHHNIWHLPFANPSSITATHPGDGELVGLWLALPTHGDEITYVMPSLFGALAIVAGAVLSREVAGRSRPAAALGSLAVVAVLTAPDIFVTQVDSLETDLVTSAALLSCLALLLVARRARSPRLVAAAGVALGLSLGSKYTGLVPGAVTAIVAITLLRPRKDWWWLVPGVTALAAPWYVRNLVDTGNPLFPERLGPLPGGKTPLALVETTMLHHVVRLHTSVLHRAFHLGVRLIGPVALVALLGVVLAVFNRRDRVGVGLVAVVAVAAAAAYTSTPVSGGGPTGLAFLIASSFRYALAALLVGSVLAAGLAAARGWSVPALVILVVVGAWEAWRVRAIGPTLRPDMVIGKTAIAAGAAGVAAAVLAMALHRYAGAPRWPSPRRLGIPATVLAGVVVFTAVAGLTYRRIDRGKTTTGIETALLRFGSRRPVVVLGIVDLRALLGPRLERPLIGVSLGGKAHETPFVTLADMQRSILGDRSKPATDPAMDALLRRAVDGAGRQLVVVDDTPFSPPGWTPSPGWCEVFDQGGTRLFARPSLLPPGATCVAPRAGSLGRADVAVIGG